jgi:hypothetical protein
MGEVHTLLTGRDLVAAPVRGSNPRCGTWMR